MSKPSEMISFGAGVNSVAMTIMLVDKGWYGPIVFADPGSEHPETLCYMDHFEREWLNPRGLEITRIMPGSKYHKKSPLPLYEFCMEQGMIPLLSVRWCSFEWKRTPMENWRKEHGIEIALLGITDDEPRRVRDDPNVAYPLVERGITRPACHRIIAQAGLYSPAKSGCWFCPGQALSQWRALFLNYPELYEQAIAMEDHVSEKLNKHATLDPHGYTLREQRDRRWKGQEEMDLSQWLPCACRL